MTRLRVHPLVQPVLVLLQARVLHHPKTGTTHLGDVQQRRETLHVVYYEGLDDHDTVIAVPLHALTFTRRLLDFHKPVL